MRKILAFLVLLMLPWAARGQNLSSFCYWFDGDDNVTELPYNHGNYQIDVTGLSPGIHFINYYVTDELGGMTSFRSAGFYRMPMQSCQKLSYWFPGDESATPITDYSDGFVVDVARLQDGFNTIYFQTDENGSIDIQAYNFIKVPQMENAGDMTLVCIIDGKIAGEEKVSARSGVVKCNMDVSKMDAGLHKAMFQLITSTGTGSSIAETYFIRTLTNEDIASMQCNYTIDGSLHRVHKGTVSNGVFHFDLPVEELEEGLHHIDYMLVSERGMSTTQGNAWFYKTPIGGNGIVRYDYWLNDNSDEIQSFQLDSPVDPLQLVKLLPVSTESIRSSCFHFEVEDENPTMYAKNDIHFRFYDKSGRWVDDDKKYIDYNVSAEVTDIADLQSTQTFARPEENSIRWFRFEAAKGDTIAFRSSQAASLQVFDPSGKEIYSASGDKSVAYGGAHTWEDGTHYVAVHDVTGSKTSITLDYMHMDKYDVVDQDIHIVGNGGYSTITFKGNGFTELEKVVLEGVSTITADSISCENDEYASVWLDFSDKELGSYKATFYFAEGTKVMDGCIIVEEAKDILLAGNVKFTNRYLVNRNNPYTIRIKNEGNSTAYDVPVAVCVFTPNLEDLTRVDIDGYDIRARYEQLAPQLFAGSMKDSIENAIALSGDKYFFSTYEDNDYVGGFPALHMTVMGVSLRPNTTETFNISINASTDACVYVWWPDTWENDITLGTSKANMARRRSLAGDGICAIIGRKASLCADNQWLEEQGRGPAYNVDCSGITPSSGVCPPNGGGNSSPSNSLDPNDIFGYTADSGGKFMKDDVLDMYYRIEFENDATFATASAHTVIVTDTLDATKFDLSSYQPTSIKIGDKDVQLKGDKEFVTTIDMRPAINAIAQVEGKYDEEKGIATWKFTSLDPMTMEETDDVMQGFLPVNHDGNGIGEVAYNINRKSGLADGTEIENRASITFDANEPILTPTWTNIIDAVAPVSTIASAVRRDSVAVITFSGEDNRSGVWKYDLYVQQGVDAPWIEAAKDIAVDSVLTYPIFDCIDYGFCALATDSAGNVEVKPMKREARIGPASEGDVNGDGNVDGFDIVAIIKVIRGKADGINISAADVNQDNTVDGFDIVAVLKIIKQK